MILKQVIHYPETNSVEATWVDEEGINVCCHSYADVQMQMFRDDIATFGGDVAEYEALIAKIEAGIKPPAPPSDEELAAQIRSEREPLLLLADRKVNTLEDKGQDASAWRAWRDALRDISLQPTFPQSVEWPEQPA